LSSSFSFRRGDIVLVTVPVGSLWEGIDPRGYKGLFPREFVTIPADSLWATTGPLQSTEKERGTHPLQRLVLDFFSSSSSSSSSSTSYIKGISGRQVSANDDGASYIGKATNEDEGRRKREKRGEQGRKEEERDVLQSFSSSFSKESLEDPSAADLPSSSHSPLPSSLFSPRNERKKTPSQDVHGEEEEDEREEERAKTPPTATPSPSLLPSSSSSCPMALLDVEMSEVSPSTSSSAGPIIARASTHFSSSSSVGRHENVSRSAESVMGSYEEDGEADEEEEGELSLGAEVPSSSSSSFSSSCSSSSASLSIRRPLLASRVLMSPRLPAHFTQKGKLSLRLKETVGMREKLSTQAHFDSTAKLVSLDEREEETGGEKKENKREEEEEEEGKKGGGGEEEGDQESEEEIKSQKDQEEKTTAGEQEVNSSVQGGDDREGLKDEEEEERKKKREEEEEEEGGGTNEEESGTPMPNMYRKGLSDGDKAFAGISSSSLLPYNAKLSSKIRQTSSDRYAAPKDLSSCKQDEEDEEDDGSKEDRETHSSPESKEEEDGVLSSH
ncbi:gram domain-containing protein, partial [Cystoisospora suis]